MKSHYHEQDEVEATFDLDKNSMLSAGWVGLSAG